jgi:hypothetical protein
LDCNHQFLRIQLSDEFGFVAAAFSGFNGIIILLEAKGQKMISCSSFLQFVD